MTTRAELVVAAEAAGLEVPARATKAELEALLAASDTGEEPADVLSAADRPVPPRLRPGVEACPAGYALWTANTCLHCTRAGHDRCPASPVPADLHPPAPQDRTGPDRAVDGD